MDTFQGIRVPAALPAIANATREIRFVFASNLEFGPLLRMLACALLMGAGCWTVWRVGLSVLSAWVGLPLVIAAGLLLYIASCALLRVHELVVIRRWLGSLPIFQLSESE